MVDAVDTIRDLCNQGRHVIDDVLEQNKTLDSDYLVWDRSMSDRAVSLELLRRVKRLLADYERVKGKLDVISDLVLLFKQDKHEAKKGGG